MVPFACKVQTCAQAAARYGTPLYAFFWNDVLDAVKELDSLRTTVPIRNWLSMKSQPIGRLLEEWKARGGGIEVVSAFELKAALAAGFHSQDILVNGVGKHSWLDSFPLKGLRVHFDSLEEVSRLAEFSRRNEWQSGIRLAVPGQYDPDAPFYSAQFGISADEAPLACKQMQDCGVPLNGIHFHLRSNVSCASEYESAIRVSAQMCEENSIHPAYLDCGGGVPCPGDNIGSETRFSLETYGAALATAKQHMPWLQEIWLENGRFVTGRAGVLVLKVIDIKSRPECRYIICDGGRTNHALVSDWESHPIAIHPNKYGRPVPSTVCGSTCMAFDWLVRTNLPEDIERGDLICWFNAGAYHIPWKTRFSHGLIPVIWVNSELETSVARYRENFESWWQMWV